MCGRGESGETCHGLVCICLPVLHSHAIFIGDFLSSETGKVREDRTGLLEAVAFVGAHGGQSVLWVQSTVRIPDEHRARNKGEAKGERRRACDQSAICSPAICMMSMK